MAIVKIDEIKNDNVPKFKKRKSLFNSFTECPQGCKARPIVYEHAQSPLRAYEVNQGGKTTQPTLRNESYIYTIN